MNNNKQNRRLNDGLYRISRGQYRIVSGSNLGKGSFGTVKKCIRLSDKTLFAVKMINIKNKKKKYISSIEKEITYLSKLRKIDGIVTLIDTYKTNKYFYIILELCNGGTLKDIIPKKPIKRYQREYHEKNIKTIFRKILINVSKMHKNGITHRDLKPENILLKNDDKLNKNKNKIIPIISDVGLSSDENLLLEICGTPLYIAPEIIDDNIPSYDNKCDIFSLGIILHELLCGKNPFDIDNNLSQKDLYQNILDGNYIIHKSISEKANDLITNMICRCNYRYNINQILNIGWMKLPTFL